MLNPEKLIYDRLGVKKEYPNNLLALSSLVVASKIYCLKTGTTIQGQLPAEGPALLIANHRRSGDIFRMCQTGRATSERIIRGVTRHTLLDPDAEEAEAVKKRIEVKNDLLNSDNPLVKFFARRLVAFVLNGIGAIPIRRGTADRAALRMINHTLREGLIVGIFLQEERVKEGNLSNIMLGPAFVAALNPDIPIIPIGISGPPDGPNRINIGKPFTYAERLKKYKDKRDLAEAAIDFADRVAELLPERKQTDWAQRRDEEYQRLAV